MKNHLLFAVLLTLLLAAPVHADAAAAKTAIEHYQLAPATVTANDDGIDATFTLQKGYTAVDVSAGTLLVFTILYENFPTAKEYRVTMVSDGVSLIKYTTTPAVMDNLYFGTMNSNGFWGSVKTELLPGGGKAGTTSSSSSSGGVIAVLLLFFASFGFFIVLGIVAIVAIYLIYRKK